MIPLEEKRRILIVDDNPTVLKLLRAICGKNGFEVDVSESGDVAVELLLQKGASVIY